MKYFTIEEFTRSETAKAKGIDNTPSEWQRNNIIDLVENLLDDLREDWGIYCKMYNLGTGAIRVSSGVRNDALNKAVGGSKTSAHTHGWAADLVPYNHQMMHFKRFCRDWLKNRAFDQMISEEEDYRGVPRWVHIGYKNRQGNQRRQFLTMKNGKYYPLTAC